MPGKKPEKKSAKKPKKETPAAVAGVPVEHAPKKEKSAAAMMQSMKESEKKSR